ncbi:MAG TPA: hypothetical protein VGM12_22330 [Trebonia sp.]|jgi:hypothetical protein
MSQPLASFQISQSFQNLLDTVFHSIPKLLVFLLVLVVGWIVAKVLARLVDLLLRRVKFDRFVERGVVGQALARSGTDATTLIARIVYYALLLVTLQLAFGVWGPNPISAMLNAVVGWLPKAVVAIIIIVIASAIARVVKDLVGGAIGGLSYGPFAASAASVVIIALGVIAALNQVGIAAAVTLPVLYTVLVTCGAIVAIGVGGGLIKPMQDRWERILTAAERETSTQVAAYQQGRADAMSAPRQGQRSPVVPQTAPAAGSPESRGYAQGPAGAQQDPRPQQGPGAQQDPRPQQDPANPAGPDNPQEPGDQRWPRDEP